MIRVISNAQDIRDLVVELSEKLPVRMQFEKDRPTEGPDKQRWVDLNAFFHTGIVPAFSERTGYNQTEAKNELQKMFALVSDAGGVIDVESTSGMNLDRMYTFVTQCSVYLMEMGIDLEKPLPRKTKRL